MGHSTPDYQTIIYHIIPVYLSEACDVSAMNEVECSQHTVRHSKALILAVGRHSQLSSMEMTRKLMVMQWCLVDTFLTQTLAGLWRSDTAVTLGVLVADIQDGWLPAGYNHCCMNSVLCNDIKQQAHHYRCICIGNFTFRPKNSNKLVQISNIITVGPAEVNMVWQIQ